MTAPAAPKCVCLDIETSTTDQYELRKLAVWRPDTARSRVVVQPASRDRSWIAEVDALSEGAAFVLGHNVVRHDLPALKKLFPELALHDLPVVDTLELSPIAFPQNPYHSLVKDYKLVRDARSDPLRDAQLALRLWRDQFEAFEALREAAPDELACHHFFFSRDPRVALGSFFATIRRAAPPAAAEARTLIKRLCRGRACPNQAREVVDEDLSDPTLARPLAYVLAWLRVSGGNSVLPPWVHLQYPATRTLIRKLRDTPCGVLECAYCTTFLDPRQELERYFGLSDFRPEPPSPDGGSLQADIVRRAYAGQSVLAILPTGGGKSICYQLPALSRHWRSGSLTIIVSPLQSLMKDQVDNLVRQGIYAGAALNGLLTMPERKDVLDRVRLGDVGMLLVSPEQFRNRAFADSIRYREIGAWVFDEAHCLSKWGHDFRPDYLYVSRFIRERYGGNLAPVCCFTATAKREVVEDLRTHFREALRLELVVLDGGHERSNLHYEVLPVSRREKMGLVHRLLEKELGPAHAEGRDGGAIVFCARQKSTEEVASFLRDMGWACSHFHGGLEAGRKKDVQQAFIAGELRVIAATNAFGMGVDKPDVRVVIHAEIPGSLENYLQEAGRAGRDRRDARCILLHDEEDVEAQFGLSARSRLSRQDIAAILRALRRYSARIRDAEVVITPGEILAQEDADTSIEPRNPDADTKVRTAIAWLERARFLERNENHTRVFPGSVKVGSLSEASRRLDRANLSKQTQRRYLDLLGALINARDDEGISTDELMLQLGLPSEECVRMLHHLEQLGLLSNDLSLTVLLRKGVEHHSLERLERLVKLETGLLDLLPELAPDAAREDWQEMSLRALCQELRTRTGLALLPEQLLTLTRAMARPFGGPGAGKRAMFDVRLLRREVLRVRLLRSWRNIREIAQRRRAVATVLLNTLFAKLDPRLRGADLRVECKVGELAAALRSDMEVGPSLTDDIAAIDAGLLFLHDNEVLILDRGKTVFRSAMTIHINREEKRGFGAADFAPLNEHYGEQNFQIHVIHEYARLGLRKLSEALAFVLAYFTLPKLAFIRRYFAGRREMLERATTEESYRSIVESLRHPLQQRLVAVGADANRLILAGPGSGKTRVIVHRVAYLVRVLREPPESVLVLAFNRSAAGEIRQRLRSLIGADAAGVTVLTYHGLALRLTGVSLAGLASHGEEIRFEQMLADALALLEGRSGIAGADFASGDELRERLLAGYRYILVDEYQDIDQPQYALISALAGRRLKEQDAKLTVMAVGDDDQNIYAFRGTSNAFIARFRDDYKATVEYLVENYRSSGHIIEVANEVIAGCGGRLKGQHPIRINHARRDDPAGGRWARLDSLSSGRVQVLAVPDDAIGQAEIVMAEVQRLHALDPAADWSDFAVLARNRTTLDPIRAWCELSGIGYSSQDRDPSAYPKLHQTREGCALFALLQAKHNRHATARGLGRWFRRRFHGGNPANPWQRLLQQFIDELEGGWATTAIPAGIIADALFEFGNEARRSEKGRITLSTVHGAKGREFKHVVILDGGDWREASDEERRLYYVGMTRAREMLTLCQSSDKPNPFSSALPDSAALCRTPLPGALLRPAELGWRYCSLGLQDVYLDFAGRIPHESAAHRELLRLDYGDRLQVVPTTKGRYLKTTSGVTVGRIAKACLLPEGTAVRASVDSLIWRTREQVKEPEFRAAIKVAGWWVVLPTIVVAS